LFDLLQCPNSCVADAPTCRQERILVVGASRAESLDIACEVETDPPARSFKWKFNNSGETLEVSPEMFAATSNGTMSILRYTPVSELDYGTLSCWAENAIGTQTSPCVFQVVAAGKMSAVLAMFTAFILCKVGKVTQAAMKLFIISEL
jgi:hypothetical protein